MGCGSGILALGIKKLWPDADVLAVDIDPESVRVTKRHADMNGANVTAVAGDGYAAKEVGTMPIYDLITANILAGPLIAMAPDLNRVLKPGGFAVLSGLLARQEQDVLTAHIKQGLVSKGHIALGDWRALILQKEMI
jgi:ribosomal protein L11 methyltransferase